MWQVVRMPDRLQLIGELRIGDAAALWNRLRVVKAERGSRLDLDLEGVSAVDGTAMALLVELRGQLVSRGVLSQLVGGDEHIAELVRLYRGDRAPPAVAQ